ncbi:MAG: hypothetical protein ACR2KK_09465 [Acidimicrobiales bacterium]
MADQERPELEPRLSASVSVGDEDALRDLLRQPLDFGCRPIVTPLPGGRYGVTVIGTEATLRGLTGDEREVEIHRLPEVPAEVGEGDRFESGRVAPRGLGRKDPAE